MNPLLTDKVAIVYGAGGAIGGAVARAFGREGASVFLAGRTRGSLDTVADAIRALGGSADADVVDALDQGSVDRYVDDVVSRAGHVDISFNVIGVDDVQRPLTMTRCSAARPRSRTWATWPPSSHRTSLA
jgi:NADP-dependent 3-hydroxy acid dehydrogenase YdfG